MMPIGDMKPTLPGAERRRTAVIIVHYNTAEMLESCVGSLLSGGYGEAEVDGGLDEIVIVDNASRPEEAERVRALGEQGPGGRGAARVTVIESGGNLGFAGANNVGIAYVRQTGGASYYVLLNPDTVVRRGALARLREFLEEHEEAGLVGPRLEYPDGRPQLSAFGDPTPVSELVRGANIGPLSRLLKRWEVYGEIRDEPHRAGWLAGACVMMREAVVERTGLLDAGFFMYFEEVDFFRRARRAGFEAWYLPEAHVVHLVGQASGVTTRWEGKRLPSYWFESRHRYFRKHFGYLGMVAADGLWLAGHALMWVRKCLTGVSHSAVARGETRDLLRHGVRAALHPARAHEAVEGVRP